MKPSRFTLPELIYNLCFLLYLGGSSLAQIQNGVELSLWLMAFAMVLSGAVTLLPWLGIGWLRLPQQGSRVGKGVALALQIGSWLAYTAAMFFRLNRNLPRFHTLIAITTLLWAAWLLTLIYSRHAFRQPESDDTLSPVSQPEQRNTEKAEE